MLVLHKSLLLVLIFRRSSAGQIRTGEGSEGGQRQEMKPSTQATDPPYTPLGTVTGGCCFRQGGPRGLFGNTAEWLCMTTVRNE